MRERKEEEKFSFHFTSKNESSNEIQKIGDDGRNGGEMPVIER